MFFGNIWFWSTRGKVSWYQKFTLKAFQKYVFVYVYLSLFKDKKKKEKAKVVNLGETY